MLYRTLEEYRLAKTKGRSTTGVRPGTRGPEPSNTVVMKKVGGFGNTTPVNGGRPV